MIIKHVDIRDFRSHRSTKIDFSEGVSVIVGENGSGKTSILESINFALFKQKPNVSMDDLIRRGADGAEVSVTFSAGGRTYRATRGRKIGKAYGSVLYSVDDDETLRKGEEGITEEIEGILGIGRGLFTSAVYIKQGEIDSLVSAQPSDRKEHVGKLLGADELERAHDGMLELMRGYENRAAELNSVPDDIVKTDASIREKNSEIRTLSRELKKASKVHASVKKRLKDVQKQLKGLEKLRGLEAEIEKKEARLENLRESIHKIEEYEKELRKTQRFHERYGAAKKEIESLADDRRKLYELRERGEGLKRELLNAGKRASQLEGEITARFDEYGTALGRKFKDFESLSDHREKVKEKLNADLEKIDRKIEGVSSKISVAAGKNGEIEKAVRELEKAGTKCPVCKGPLDKKHKKGLLADYTRNIEKNQTRIEKWDSSLKTLEEKKEEIEESLENAASINIELLKSLAGKKRDIEKSIMKIKSSIGENEKSLKGLSKIEKRISEKEKEKSKLMEGNERHIAAKSYLRRYLPEKKEFQAEVKKAEKLVSRLKNNVKRLGGPLDAKKFEGMKLEEKELQEKYSASQNEKTRLDSRKGYEKEGLKDLKKHLVELKSKEKKRAKLSKFLVLLKDIRDLFHKDFLQRKLRTKALPIIEAHTKDIFDMFNLPYTDIKLTDDFNVVLFSPHGEESVDMLSGGERIAAALALRIGIAKALSGSAMELIILDEPTIHLDSHRRQDLVEIIKRLSSIPQTIVVTHDKEFEQAADRLIVVEKVNGISKVG